MLLWTDSTWQACCVSASDGVLVALSGGADSVALLLELKKLQRNGLVARVEAAHLHHGIRGDSADADAAFVSALCDRLGIPLSTERVDVPKLAKETGTSLELAARNARYAFLERSLSDIIGMIRRRPCFCIFCAGAGPTDLRACAFDREILSVRFFLRTRRRSLRIFPKQSKAGARTRRTLRPTRREIAFVLR